MWSVVPTSAPEALPSIRTFTFALVASSYELSALLRPSIVPGGHGAVDGAGYGTVSDFKGRLLAVVVKAGSDEASDVRRVLRVDVYLHGAAVYRTAETVANDEAADHGYVALMRSGKLLSPISSTTAPSVRQPLTAPYSLPPMTPPTQLLPRMEELPVSATFSTVPML